MGLGEMLAGWGNSFNDTINNFIADHNDSYKGYLDQEEKMKKVQQDHPSFFQSSSGQLGAVFAVGGESDTFNKLMAWADSGRRAADTMLITAKHAGAVSNAQGGSDSVAWGELTNKANWSKAWDLADNEVFNEETVKARIKAETGRDASPAEVQAYAQANSMRASGGNIFASQAFGHNDRIEVADPFAAKDAIAIQQAANDTWYGTVSSTLVDLGTSFIAPPGAGIAAKAGAAARAGRAIKGTAEAEAAAARFADLGVAGTDAAKSSKIKDFGANYAQKSGWVNAEQSVDSILHRQMVGLRDFEGLTQSEAMDLLAKRMPNAPEGARATLADAFTQINEIPDAMMRDKLRMNLMLAGHGSTTARAALASDHALLAKSFENLTSKPREFDAVERLYAQRLGADNLDYNINGVIDEVWNTKADKVEMQHLLDDLEVKAEQAKQARSLFAEIRAGKPSIKNIDADALRQSRSTARQNVYRLNEELKQAKVELKGNRRWASAAYKKGELRDVADMHASLGDARTRVAELEKQLGQAKADHDLLHSTPIPGFEDLGVWREDMNAARDIVAKSRSERDIADAFARTKKQEIKAKQAEIRDSRKAINRSNDVLNDILNLGQDAATMLSGGAERSAMDALRSHVRERIGTPDHYMFNGEGNAILRVASLPDRIARRALAPQARGSIALNEIDLGRRQLNDTLSRSGVFSREEALAAQNELIQTKGYARQNVVAKYQRQMLERKAVAFFEKEGIHKTPQEAAEAAKKLTGLMEKSFGQGRQWVSRAANEQVRGRFVHVKGVDGDPVAFDHAALRAHLADNAPILDPWDIDRLLRQHRSEIIDAAGVGGALRRTGTKVAGDFDRAVQRVGEAHDLALSVWKVGALARPALMVRSMLDTGPRALASLSAAESLIATMNGVVNITHNTALKGLARVGMAGSPDQVAARMRAIGMKVHAVEQGGKRIEYSFAKDAADLRDNLAAASKGNTVHGALFNDMKAAYNGIKVDRAKWARRKAGDPHWAAAYQEYASTLLASPTARKVADLMAQPAAGVDVAKLRREIKNSPEFLAEFRQIAEPLQRSREEFLNHVLHEVNLMFPSQRLLDAAKNGGLTKKLVDTELPDVARFDIPSPEISVVESHKVWEGMKSGVDRMFRLMLDKPDMWLARNPVAVMRFNRAMKQEYADVARKFGKDFEVPSEMQAAIERRARSEAISYVRRTFFDTTRYTGAHRYVTKISPFFAAWEDAMMSWGKLIAEDPRRFARLSAAYHAPFTIASSTGNALVFDQSGNPIGPGDHPDGVFVGLPQWAVKGMTKAGAPVLKAMGMDVNEKNLAGYRFRLDALNSIWQGETWWLPGTGPNVTVPLTAALGNDKLIDRETTLALVGTDNWFGKQVMKSMFLGGELPASDAGSVASSMAPGWIRNLATETLGTGKVRNRQTTFNYLVAEAMHNGDRMTPDKYRALWQRANDTANAAAAVRLIAGAGLGLTGTARVDGQFYADQMNIIEAMPPDLRGGLTAEEFFAQQFPEAADLKWNITKNETGIQATAHAAKAEARLDGLLSRQENKELGWMIVGSDNMVAGEFSRTAYNLQRSDGRRHYLSPEDAQQQAQAAVGQRQYMAWSQQMLDMVKQYGLDENSDQYAAGKRAIRDYLMQSNPAWAKDQTEITNKFDLYYSQAMRLSQDKSLRDRKDFQLFRQYDATRRDVMKQFGIKSFKGTKPEYVAARKVMTNLGNRYGAENLGFLQMWQRFLGREMEVD